MSEMRDLVNQHFGVERETPPEIDESRMAWVGEKSGLRDIASAYFGGSAAEPEQEDDS